MERTKVIAVHKYKFLLIISFFVFFILFSYVFKDKESDDLLSDLRVPVKMNRMKAEKQLEKMRIYLEIMSSISESILAKDYESIYKQAKRLVELTMPGTKTSRSNVEPGFIKMGEDLNRKAKDLSLKAKTYKIDDVMKGYSLILKSCVACHAVYKQQIVLEKNRFSNIKFF